MRAFVLALGAMIFVPPAWAEFDAEALATLGQGKWGLVEGTGTASDISDARKCDKTAVMFAFTSSEIQRITFINGQPPAGPPDFFGDIKVEKGVTATTFSLFANKGDAKPAAVYSFDATAKTLAHTDAVPGETYALCAG